MSFVGAKRLNLLLHDLKNTDPNTLKRKLKGQAAGQHGLPTLEECKGVLVLIICKLWYSYFFFRICNMDFVYIRKPYLNTVINSSSSYSLQAAFNTIS